MLHFFFAVPFPRCAAPIRAVFLPMLMLHIVTVNAQQLPVAAVRRVVVVVVVFVVDGQFA